MSAKASTNNEEQAAQLHPLPIAQTDRDLIGDVLKLSEANREGVNRFMEATTGQQNVLLRDMLNISIPLVVGAISLLALPNLESSGIIKTRSLFITSLVILVVDVVINLFVRLQVIRYIRGISYVMEKHHIDMTVVANSYLLNPTPDNARIVNETERQLPQLQDPTWLVNNGHRICAILLIVGFIGIGLSILFKIST